MKASNNTTQKTMADQEFRDIVVQYMTDEEKYEVEAKDTGEAIRHFISVFGDKRWTEISRA